MYIPANKPVRVHRHPVAQCTDGARGRVAYQKGIHVFEVKWKVNSRGTHATIGFGTGQSGLDSFFLSY